MSAPTLDVTRIAQTNVALFRQMHRLEYPQDALIVVRDAYELATALFTGRYRASGKPFLCHLVGTASVLASLRADAEVVAAGVLHAAYDTNPHTGMAASNRKRVRDVVGAATEQHVFAYSQFTWSVSSIRALAARGLSPEDTDKPIVLMRLANEVDDHLDDAMAYCAPSRRKIDAGFENWIEMAGQLGYAPLAEALRILRAEQANSTWAQPLALGRPGSYAIASPRAGWARRILAYVR